MSRNVYDSVIRNNMIINESTGISRPMSIIMKFIIIH